eukprot:4420063-Alexandrium_andersonii.AAC.1
MPRVRCLGGGPAFPALRTGGAALRAAPPARRAAAEGGRQHPPTPIPGQGRFALRACWGPQPLPCEQRKILE